MISLHRMVIAMYAAFVLSAASLYAETTIRGNISGENPESTFSFKTRAWTARKDGKFVVLGSAHEGTQEYAISALAPHLRNCLGIMHEQVLDGNSEMRQNPLFSQAIDQLVILEKFGGHEDCLFVVSHAQPQTLHIVDGANPQSGQRRIHSSPVIPDASNQQVNGGIVGIEPVPLLAINRENLPGTAGVVFLAVRGHDQSTFGVGDSGITAVCLAEVRTTEMRPAKEPEKTPEQKKEEERKKAAAKKAGKPEPKEEQKMEERVITRWTVERLPIDGKKSVLPLNRSTKEVKIGNDLAQMGDVVALHWHEKLNRLYIGLQTHAADGESDGSCALLVGSFSNEGMILSPVTEVDFFERGAADKIVGAVGAGFCVSIHRITSMRTSMALDYLIVVGGNGSGIETKRSVYALPVLTNPLKKIAAETVGRVTYAERMELDQKYVGQLAAKNAPVHEAVELVDFGQRVYYAFDRAPHNVSEVTRSDDSSARVGGGPLAYGEIIKTEVHGDSVIVVVHSDDKTMPSGVFVSQAIFKENRHIAGWTRWAPLATTYEPMIGASVQATTGIATIITDAPDSTQIKRAEWSEGSSTGVGALVAAINTTFSPNEGGVHSLRTLVADQQQALLAVTGLKKVLLIAHEMPSTIFEPGCFDQRLLTGGALSELGAITCVALYEEADKYLVVGGVEGLAISPKLGGDYVLPDGQAAGDQFVRFGDYRFVKKIVCDNGYAYILTDHCLDRIDLQASCFESNELVRVRLADVRQFAKAHEYACFNDVIISDHAAFLATTQGLWINKNSVAQATINSAADLGWYRYDLECDIENVVSLYAVSQTGLEHDVARGCGGQLYVINGFVGKNRARLNRLYVRPVDQVTDAQPLLAKLADSTKGRCFNAYQVFQSYRDMYVADGLLRLSARYTDYAERLSVKHGFKPETAILVPQSEQSRKIVAVCREPIAGSLLVAGDFGVRVLE